LDPKSSGFVAFVVTLALSPLVLVLLRRLQLLDTPNPRSLHEKVTPRGGGLSVAAGALTGMALTPGGGGKGAVIIGAAAFGALGMADDVFQIPALPRLMVQALLGGTLFPLLLQDVDGPASRRVVLGIVAALWVVSYVNAFNFMDGINGISAVQAILAGGYWYAVGIAQSSPTFAAGALMIAAASAAFVPFNFPRARMFLGDVGSYFIGAWMAVVAVIGLRTGLAMEAVVAPVALYLTDTLSTIVRRVLRGERWYEAHRDHVYQHLVAIGWSHTRTTLFVGGLIAVCCGLGAMTLQDPGVRLAADAALLAVLAGYLLAPTLLRRKNGPPPSP
jgi:UDP-N-acetylmuramyl pentapeptide phosphotransferase/UDP-N-acetylglucosamine-1-phosphate transferase